MRWAFVIAAKILLSQLRIPYGTWRRLNLFRLGAMDDPGYALKIFRLHQNRAFDDPSLMGKTILEIGPGDSLASAVIGRAYGADTILLVDVGDFADHDLAPYRAIAERLRAEGLPAPDLGTVRDFDAFLECCHARYLTDGLRSLAAIPPHCVDYIWSHSVLEHVRKSEVEETFRQFRRILRPDGRMSHNVDFQDHLAHSLNSLRFPERVWESDFMRSAGFYTNRIRAKQMHQAVREAGFAITDENFGRWPALPLPRRKLDAAFQALDEDDLRIRTSSFCAQPSAADR